MRNAGWPVSGGNELFVLLPIIVAAMAIVDEASVNAIGVNDDHLGRADGSGDFGTREVVVAEEDDMLNVREVQVPEEVSVPALNPVKVKMTVSLLDTSGT